MKILFSSYFNPTYINTSVYRERALRQLGHDVISFHDRAFLLPGRIRQKIGFLAEWDLRRLNRSFVNTALKEKPDLCMIVGGYRILLSSLHAIRKAGIKLVLWTTDAPVQFENVVETASSYDFIFCAGTEAVDILSAEGCKNVAWLPFGCDPQYHRPVELSESERDELAKDLVFVGAHYPNRANILEAIADLDLGVWGPNWNFLDNHCMLRKKAVDARINYDSWVRIYSAARIVLVIHFQDSSVPCHQASPKLYEALACGSFVLVDAQKDAEALFEDGKHVVFFKNSQDLRDKISYYLGHADERERIARQGYQEVLDKHTYTHRMQEMLGAI